MKNNFPFSNFHFPMNSQIIKFINSKAKLVTQTHWRLATGDWKFQCGFSLIEILVVLAVFSILAIVVAQGIFVTLRGARKSETTTRVKENLAYAIAVVERQLHNASEVTPCPNTSPTRLDFKDEDGKTSYFSCQSVGPAGYVASGSATIRLTSDNVSVTACSFVCATPSPGVDSPPSVDINITAQDATTVGAEGAQVTTSTKVFLRTY